MYEIEFITGEGEVLCFPRKTLPESLIATYEFLKAHKKEEYSKLEVVHKAYENYIDNLLKNKIPIGTSVNTFTIAMINMIKKEFNYKIKIK